MTRDIVREEMNIRFNKARVLFMTGMKIGKMDAELYVGQESPERLRGGKLGEFTLIFGDGSFSWVVKATFDADMENELGLITLQSILNTRLSDGPRLPAGADVDFVITPGRLSIVDGFIDRMVFALEGEFPSHSQLPIFMVGRSLIDVSEADRRLTARRMANPPGLYQLRRISSFKEIEIDGLTGFETLAVGLDQATNQPLQFYSVSLFDGPRHYLMNGWVGAG